MRNGLTMVQDKIQTLVDTLVNHGVVCKTTVDGELLLELYSLLEGLEPEADDLSERLSKVRLVPTRTEVLGMYVVYVPLPDALAHLMPASTLPEAHTLRQWLATADS
jgi:hypothetical protein